MIKKICLFCGHYDPARQTIMNYFEEIFPKNIKFFIVCASKFDREKYKLKRTKVIEFLGKKSSVPFKLRKFLIENDIDVITNLTGEAAVGMTMFFATIFTKTKRIHFFLANPRANLKNSFFFLSQFSAARFLACGKEVSDKIKKALVFSNKKTFYLPFPINTDIFKPKDKEKMRKKFGFSKNDKIIIFVGRIEILQGSDYLLELVKTNPDKKFILIGSLNDENFKNNKFKNLTYIPFVKNIDLPEYYSIANISLFLSKRNSYAYPPRESMACGTPVILFNLETFGQLKTPAAKKTYFDINHIDTSFIQKEIDSFFSLSENQKKILSKEARNFVVNDSSYEKIKPLTIKYLTEFPKNS